MATGTNERTGSQRAGLGVLAVLAAGGFALLTWLVATGVVIPFDQPMLATATAWTALNPEWHFLSDAANFPLIGIGVGLVAGLLLTHHRREAILVVAVLALATAGSELVKQLVARPRPPGGDVVVPGVVYSYPSGHVLEALTIFGIIAILLWRTERYRWLAAAFAAFTVIFVSLVAVARVALNAHYPSDVLGGILAGIAVLAAFAIFVPRRSPAPHREIVEPKRRTEPAAATGAAATAQDVEHHAHAG